MEGRGGGKLIALIGDEVRTCMYLRATTLSLCQASLYIMSHVQDTCTGFLLGGIGEVNAKKKANFLVVGKDTSVTTIDETFNDFVRRADVAVVLINQHVS